MDSLVLLLTESGPVLLSGLVTSLKLLVLSCLFGFMLAVPLAVARSAQSRWLSLPSRAFMTVFRGTPLLVQLFILYYGLAQFDWVRHSPLWLLLEGSFSCALLALTLNIAAYMAEDIRGGIAGVPAGEQEAAAAFGMSRFMITWYIVVPRAIGIVAPTLANEVVLQLKSTALASTITVLDLTGVARRLSIAAYDTDALILAGVAYVAIAALLSSMLKFAEGRLNPHLLR
ncbi:ABC transporter permease subunit [Crenobacter sp. SG2303]|uniref:ABC transporter permease subunit n=1 Tax=Crenobacter oryzisoli TaxID=3056844 RepID=A0ABT7XSC3_9NEIS|nr:ABC transporter permease subunit [Crenobacter sp. SG2303]MDN0076692.1 ABC transporter permease subunit [Crenobacter sp. SG2303]